MSRARSSSSTAQQRPQGRAPNLATLLEIVHEDCYVRHTDKDGKRYVRCHRVWNRDHFMRQLAAAALQLGGKAKAELITEAMYRKELRR